MEENGTYKILSGPVSVEFKSDERITNLPHIYVSLISVDFDTAPVDDAKIGVYVANSSGFETQIAEMIVRVF